MKTYNEFWEELSKIYPISKGELRLPISCNILELEEIDLNSLYDRLENILNQLIKSYNIDTSINNSRKNDEEKIIPLLENKLNGIIRFDCIINNNNEVKIIEINSDYPDGLLMHDKTYSQLLGKEVSPNKDLFLELFEKDKNIFVMYEKGSFFLDAYHTEYLELKNNGFKVNIGNIDDLEVKGKNILYNGEKIDTIRRCMETGKIQNIDIDKFTNKDINFINNFDIRTLGYKDLLSEIDNEIIPKTYTLKKENYNDFIDKKDNFVIKPSNLYEGKGVIIGKDTNNSEWKNELLNALNTNSVIQEFVDIKKINISFYQDQGIVNKNLYFDFCPHFFIKNGKIIGKGLTLARFSENKILNVMMGGGIGYIKTL